MKIILEITMNPFGKIASLKELWVFLEEKFKDYSDTKEAQDWFNKNWSRTKALFENYTLRDFIFEPFMFLSRSQNRSDLFDFIANPAPLWHR